MDESTRITLGLIVGVGLLLLSSWIRRRARQRGRPKGDGPTR